MISTTGREGRPWLTAKLKCLRSLLLPEDAKCPGNKASLGSWLNYTLVKSQESLPVGKAVCQLGKHSVCHGPSHQSSYIVLASSK